MHGVLVDYHQVNLFVMGHTWALHFHQQFLKLKKRKQLIYVLANNPETVFFAMVRIKNYNTY